MDKKEHKNIYRSMLEEYFSGTIDGELADRIRSWIPESRDAEETDKILGAQFEKFVSECTEPSRSTQQAWKKISAALGFREKKAKTFLNINIHRNWTKVAAVVIPLIIVSGAYLWLNLRKENITEPVVAAVTYNAELSAPEDGKKRIHLPDGTEVFLNAGANLAYDSINYSSARNVRLSGEAYFSVVKNEDAAFVVDAGDITATVLGTEFNVKTGGSNGYSEVSLFSGSVEVRSKDKAITLLPNQQVIIEAGTGAVLVKELDGQTAGEWRLRLDLDNVSLPRAFGMIQDYFGIPAVIEGTFPGENMVRVSFKEPTVDEAMEIVQMITNGFEYSIESDTLRITSKR